MTWRGRSHSPSPATFIWNDYVLCEQFQHYLRMLWVTITFNSHGLTDNQINFTSKPKQVYTSLATLLQLYPMKEVSTTLIWTLQWHFLFLFFPESNFLLNEVGQNWQMLNLPLQTSRGRSQGWDKGVGPRPAILNASNDPQQFLFFSFHPTKKTMPALPNLKKKTCPCILTCRLSTKLCWVYLTFKVQNPIHMFTTTYQVNNWLRFHFQRETVNKAYK